MKILVLSCDKNEDLFPLFHHCIEKYWPEHPEVYYSTESIVNPYYKTICHAYDIEHWTKRIRETVGQIDDEFILIMVDDIFIQERVDNNKVLNLIRYFKENTASLNLQPTFDIDDCAIKDDIMERNPNGEFHVSVMCSLWKKSALLDVFNYDTNPWQFEWDNKKKGYQYLVTWNGGYLNWGFTKKTWRFGLHYGQWFKEAITFFNKEGIKIDYTKRGIINMDKCFGICSYMPDEFSKSERLVRQNRLTNLVKQLDELWPEIPILFIAQNWKDFKLPKIRNQVIRFDYEPLGLMGARNTLRERFLETEYNWLIMFDDDCILKCDTPKASMEYMTALDNNPGKFCFIKGGNNKYNPYADSQLNLCAISRNVYEKYPLPKIDPQKSEGFEDRIWSTFLHYVHPELEFEAPKTIYPIHFKNPEINKFGGEVASTWCINLDLKWRTMRNNTVRIEEFIINNKRYPNDQELAKLLLGEEIGNDPRILPNIPAKPIEETKKISGGHPGWKTS